LVGFIGGFTFEPDFEQGIVDEGVGEFYPLKLTLSAEFTVLHTHAMGWTVNSTSKKPGASMGLGEGASGFPYTTPNAGATAGALGTPAAAGIPGAPTTGGTTGGTHHDADGSTGAAETDGRSGGETTPESHDMGLDEWHGGS
jgi:hypothetical protein